MFKFTIELTGQKMCDLICECEKFVKWFSRLKVIGQITLVVNKPIYPECNYLYHHETAFIELTKRLFCAEIRALPGLEVAAGSPCAFVGFSSPFQSRNMHINGIRGWKRRTGDLFSGWWLLGYAPPQPWFRRSRVDGVSLAQAVIKTHETTQEQSF